MPNENKTLYLVLQWHWRVNDENSEQVSAGDPRLDVRPCPDDPGSFEIVTYTRNPDDGGKPDRAFHDYAKAMAYCREQESAQRARTNPFRYGGSLEARTSLDLARLCDWLLDADLTPPDSKWEEKPERIHAAWDSWWKKLRLRLTEKQRIALANAVRNGLAERWFGEAEYGPDDLEWLDEQFAGIERWTPTQRSVLRMGLFSASIQKYPAHSGERDHMRVEEKWRDWWDRQHKKMTEYQKGHVWKALDKLRFYEVVELDAPE